MASLNKVQIIGHLGQDPEVRYTQSGDAVATLSVATTESWKDKDSGEKREATEWHRVILWRRLGEIAGQYLKKGSQVYIEGKLQTRKWTDQNGADRYTTEIKGEEIKMLGDPKGGQSTAGQDRSHSKKPSRDNDQDYDPAPRKERPKPNFDDLGEDIPFICHNSYHDEVPGPVQRMARYGIDIDQENP